MEKYFANYNQSLALKELGFDEPCFGTWKKDVDGTNPAEYTIDFHTKTQLDHDLCPKNSDYTNDWVSAPLKSQVFEWFRKNYNTNTCISWRDDLLNYDISLTEMKKGGYFYYKENFNNYEEAESACVDKIIEVIKNEQNG